jgi:Uma2 family endonuclease
MSTAMHEWPRRHRITVEHFYRMAEAGLFDEKDRVELVNGEIIDVLPMGSRHAGTLYRLASMLSTALTTRAVVRQQLPLRLSEDSEPLPDIAVVKPRADDYTTGHPTAADAWLVVEISQSTLRYDRDVKTALYAAFAVPEVWVIDLPANQVHVYRSPLNAGYAVTDTLELGPLAVPSLQGAVVDLTPLRT